VWRLSLENKVHLGLLPFFHSYGMLVMNAAILGPHPLVVIQKFDLKVQHV
jgi:hypothetical protein